MHVKQERRSSGRHTERHTERQPGSPRLRPRKDIQGLRALAVTLVVLDHAGVPFMAGGFIGVDVFFVVSGFLITQLLIREASRTGSVSLARFYARRARRILPVSTLVLLVTSVVAALTLSASRAKEVVEDVLWSSAFAANIQFAQLGTDYFSQDRALSPVQHYWSLAVEEQFYLVLPLLFGVLVLWGRRRLDAGKSFPGRRVVGGFVGVLTLASLVWSVVATPMSPTSAYFSSLTRGWELGAGVLLALALPVAVRLSHRRRVALSTVGLLAILVAAVAFHDGTAFPGYAALLPVLGTLAVLAAGAGQDGQGLARVLTWRPVTWIGDLSYSIYLWHWPALVLCVPLLTGDDPVWLEKAVVLGGVLAVSMVSYHLVEQPFRHGRVPGTRARMALVLWPASVGAVVLATVWVSHYQAQQTEQRAIEAQQYYGEETAGSADTAPLGSVRVEESVALADEGAPIHFPLTNLEDLEDDHWAEAYPCYAAFRDTTAPFCELGDVESDRTVVAFGDSHTGMWLPTLDAIGSSDGFRVVPFVKWACASIDVPTPTARGSVETCSAFRAWATEQIRELEPEAILLSNRVLPPNLEADEDDMIQVWQDGIRSTVATLSEIAPTSVFSDVPRLEVDPGDCVSAPDSTMETCTVVPSAKSIQGIIATRSAAEEVGAPVVNVATMTCFEQRCPLVVDQTVTYRDEDHISMTWATELTEELRQRLAVAFAGP